MTKGDRDDILDVYSKQVSAGIPAKICYGTREEQARWLQDRLTAVLNTVLAMQEPEGTVKISGYEACPRCGGVIGVSAYYCKKCGAYIREQVL